MLFEALRIHGTKDKILMKHSRVVDTDTISYTLNFMIPYFNAIAEVGFFVRVFMKNFLGVKHYIRNKI
jgi:hypothetical protein